MGQSRHACQQDGRAAGDPPALGGTEGRACARGRENRSYVFVVYVHPTKMQGIRKNIHSDFYKLPDRICLF